MHAVSWLVICGSGPWLWPGMYPSAIAQTLSPIFGFTFPPINFYDAAKAWTMPTRWPFPYLRQSLPGGAIFAIHGGGLRPPLLRAFPIAAFCRASPRTVLLRYAARADRSTVQPVRGN